MDRTGEGVSGTEMRVTTGASVYEDEKMMYTAGSIPVRLLTMTGSLPFWPAEMPARPRTLSASVTIFMSWTKEWLRLEIAGGLERESSKVESLKDFVWGVHAQAALELPSLGACEGSRVSASAVEIVK